MKSIAVVIVALTLAFTVYITSAADDSSRPPGIQARDWLRVSDRLGFVITREEKSIADRGGDSGAQMLLAAPENLAADLMPPLKGYFVIQTPTGWRQVVMSQPIPTAQ